METILESMTLGNRPPPAPLTMRTSTAIAIPGAGKVEITTPDMRHAQSFIDCEQVLLQAAIKDPKPSAPTATPMQRSTLTQAALLGGELTAVQEDEDEMAQVGFLGWAGPVGLGRGRQR